jgi:FkbM family methyltransferase
LNFLSRQLSDIRTYGWGFFSRKVEKFRYVNPLAGLLFTLTKEYYETEGCKFVFPKDLTSVVYRARFYYDLYEWEERRHVNQFLRQDDSVVEIGACIGILSCVTNKKLKEAPERHVVIEPNPELIPYIEKNRELNGCHFSIEQCLITDEIDPSFYTAKHISKGSIYETSRHQIKVKPCRLADLETKYGRFTVLIMDIQGGETDLLELERSTLTNFRLVIAEFHPVIIGEAAVERCRVILREEGFQLREKIGDVETWGKPEASPR